MENNALYKFTIYIYPDIQFFQGVPDLRDTRFHVKTMDFNSRVRTCSAISYQYSTSY